MAALLVALMVLVPKTALTVAADMPSVVLALCAAVPVVGPTFTVVIVDGTESDPPFSDPHAPVNGTRTTNPNNLRTSVVVARRFHLGNGARSHDRRQQTFCS
ncbi:MAG TPA: hypothetical protein VI197_21760 [Polyangiaceae bacterium]